MLFDTVHSKRIIMYVSVMVTIFVVMAIIPTPSLAWVHQTGDGLKLTGGNGRVTDLDVGGSSLDFCGSENGGFYIRDYTLDPNTGLPYGLDGIGNMLECSDFEEHLPPYPDCETCLSGTSYWQFSFNTPTQPTNLCAELDLISSSTTAAKIAIPTGATTNTYYIGIYQDININSASFYENPTTHDLFCFSFDLATACGFRPQDHPDGWTSSSTEYGRHQIISRIDWFRGDPTLIPFKPTPPSSDQTLAAAYTEAKVWESTGVATSAGGNVDTLTSCGSRSYRPLDATWVRCSV